MDNKKHHIFCYGSLINQKSRKITGKTKHNIIVNVKGLKRGWYQKIESDGQHNHTTHNKHQMTVLGVVPSKHSYCNGILFEVKEDELRKFDLRELGYSRVRINKKNIIIKDKNKIIPGKVWVYLINKVTKANKKFPIAQSYVDICLSGCFDISNEFAQEFMKTTKSWSKHIINDRKSPRYIRAMKKNSMKKEIDVLVKKFYQ